MTDETTQQQGDQTSADGSGTTSEENPTLTITQARAMAEKARSDALSEVGRLRKAVEDNERIAGENKRIAEDVFRRLQEREEAELRREEEAAMDDPDKLSAIRGRRAATRRLAEVEARERQVKAQEAELQTQSKEVLAIRAERLAEKYNVEQTVLLKYGGSTKESMEELARSFGERKAISGETRTRVTTAPDSGKTTGGGGSKQPTLEELRASSPAETERKIKSGEWRVPGWS